MINNIDVIKGLELVNVIKESILNSHTPREYIIAGLFILFILCFLIFGVIASVREYKANKKRYGDGCGYLFWAIYISIVLVIIMAMVIPTVDGGVRDLKAQNSGEENCVIVGTECSREVLEVKIVDEEIEDVGEFMREFEERYEVVEVGDNGVWKVVVRE